MRQLCGFLLLTGLAAAMAEYASAQPGRFGGGRGGPPGGGFSRPGSGGPPGGGYSRPGSGGPPSGGYSRPGGGSSRGGDSGDRTERFFMMLSKGSDVIDRSKLDDRAKGMLDNMGIKGDRITKEQFKQGMEKARERFYPGGGSSSSGSSRSSSGSSSERSKEDEEKRMKERTEYYFRRRDDNKNGVLEEDEMSDTLREDRKKWDKNRDGKISLEEFQPYVKDYEERRRSGDRSRGRDDKKDEKSAERVRPDVYYYGNLPEDLPTWFSEYDTDMDAQIGLYEWVPSGREIKEFESLDVNGDGLLTPREMLAFQAAEEAKEKGEDRSRGSSDRDRDRDRDDGRSRR